MHNRKVCITNLIDDYKKKSLLEERENSKTEMEIATSCLSFAFPDINSIIRICQM